MRRPGASAALASAALVAGGMVASVLAPTRPAGTVVERPAETTPTPRAPARLAPPPVLPATRARAPEEPRAEPVASAPAVLERALAELERQLAHEPFDEHGFLLAARALAPRLDPTELEAALAADQTPARLVAAAELLRARGEGGGVPLPASAARRLRSLARDAPAPLADAAARTLIAQGGRAEARHWIAALNDEDAALRLRAARALAWADAPTSARELAEALDGIQDEHARTLAAASLTRLAARLEPWTRAELADLLTTDPANPYLARVAVRLAGAAPDPVATVLDPSEPDEARFAAAVELAREPSLLAPVARIEAVASLRAALAPEEPAATRRAALHALGALAAREAAGDLARAARDDPDPTVRSAALVALRRCDPELRLACLQEAELHEPVPAVRAVAASELARATPRD